MKQLEDGLSKMWERLFEWLPQLLAAVVILLISYAVAKIFQTLITKLLQRLDFDSHIHNAPGGTFTQRAFPYPSHFAGSLVYWLLYLGGLSIALSSLGIPLLNTIIDGIYHYIPNILAALIIFLVASAASAGTSVFVGRTLGDTPSGKIVAAAAPVLIMSIATFMILEQLKIAPAIVTITYTGLIGSLFLGLALAFGLGGRDVAATILQNAYQKSQEHKAQFQQDLETAKSRAKKAKAKLA